MPVNPERFQRSVVTQSSHVLERDHIYAWHSHEHDLIAQTEHEVHLIWGVSQDVSRVDSRLKGQMVMEIDTIPMPLVVDFR